jgi:hypothetical protein
MPTTKPRLSVTLEPADAAILERLSALSGNSQSAIVGELLASSREVFERMVQLLEAAARLRAQGERVPQQVSERLGVAQGQIEAHLGLVLATLDEGTRPLLAEAERVRRRAGRTAARSAGADPARLSTPISNRGVTPHPKGRK